MGSRPAPSPSRAWPRSPSLHRAVSPQFPRQTAVGRTSDRQTGAERSDPGRTASCTRDRTRGHAEDSLLVAMGREEGREWGQREMPMAASMKGRREGERRSRKRFVGFARQGRTLDGRKKGELKTAQSEKRMEDSLG